MAIQKHIPWQKVTINCHIFRKRWQNLNLGPVPAADKEFRALSIHTTIMFIGIVAVIEL
jgi:hypothetical protein